jgi:uncharacterized protein (UPF0261 family)
MGIPQVVAPGALEIVNFGPRESLPEAFSGPQRRSVMHSASVTSVRVSAAEAARIGARFAQRVNEAVGPTVVLLPLGGCSTYALPGGPFTDMAADAALFEAIRAGLRPDIPVRDVDANLNEATFAAAAAAALFEIWDRSERLPAGGRNAQPSGTGSVRRTSAPGSR